MEFLEQQALLSRSIMITFFLIIVSNTILFLIFFKQILFSQENYFDFYLLLWSAYGSILSRLDAKFMFFGKATVRDNSETRSVRPPQSYVRRREGGGGGGGIRTDGRASAARAHLGQLMLQPWKLRTP